MIRIYQPVLCQVNNTIELTEAARHHLARVLRAKISDEVIIFNGDGGEYRGEIIAISKKSLHVNLKEFIDRNTESPLKITLAQGISRGEKMDFTLQKAVELGVWAVVPLLTERCNVRLDPQRLAKRREHWQGVIVSACEQSGRTMIPSLAQVQTFTQWIGQAHENLKLLLAPGAPTKWSDLALTSEKSLVIVVGSEGGLTEAEILQARQNNFISLNFGPRILRTETAGLAMIAALQAKWGDLG